MQGYSPTFEVKSDLEIAAQSNFSFIELGIKEDAHEKNCKCEKCIKVK